MPVLPLPVPCVTAETLSATVVGVGAGVCGPIIPKSKFVAGRLLLANGFVLDPRLGTAVLTRGSYAGGRWSWIRLVSNLKPPEGGGGAAAGAALGGGALIGADAVTVPLPTVLLDGWGGGGRARGAFDVYASRSDGRLSFGFGDFPAARPLLNGRRGFATGRMWTLGAGGPVAAVAADGTAVCGGGGGGALEPGFAPIVPGVAGK